MTRQSYLNGGAGVAVAQSDCHSAGVNCGNLQIHFPTKCLRAQRQCPFRIRVHPSVRAENAVRGTHAHEHITWMKLMAMKSNCSTYLSRFLCKVASVSCESIVGVPGEKQRESRARMRLKERTLLRFSFAPFFLLPFYCLKVRHARRSPPQLYSGRTATATHNYNDKCPFTSVFFKYGALRLSE